MKNKSQIKHMEDNRWAQVAALETDVQGIKQDVAGLDVRFSGLEGKMEVGFTRLYDSLEKHTRRDTPWGVIFTALGLIVTLCTCMAFTANAYFGQGIAAAQREAARSIETQVVIMGQIEAVRTSQVKADITAAVLTERSENLRSEIDRLRAGRHP